MTPVGHAAFTYLTVHPRARRASGRAAIWAVVGAMIPDLVDKSLLLAGVFPWGRTIGHAAFVWIAVSCCVYLWHWAARPIPRIVWMTWGGWSHLLCDLIDDFSAGLEFLGYAFSAWFGFPWTNPDIAPLIVGPRTGPIDGISTFELGCIALAVLYIVWRHYDPEPVLHH